MSKPTIAVDIDEVLVPYAEGLVEYHNNKYGTRVRFEDVLHHNFDEFWEVSHEEYLRRAWQYIIENHKTAAPIKGAKETMKRLHKRYKILLITFRSAPLKEATLYWLDKHFEGYFDEPVFLGDKQGTGAHVATKAEICNKIGAEWLIDDHLAPILEASGAGIKGILFGNYPWNQAELLPEGVTRVKNWQEVQEYFTRTNSQSLNVQKEA